MGIVWVLIGPLKNSANRVASLEKAEFLNAFPMLKRRARRVCNQAHVPRFWCRFKNQSRNFSEASKNSSDSVPIQFRVAVKLLISLVIHYFMVYVLVS